MNTLSSVARYKVTRKTNFANLAYTHDKHFGKTRRSCPQTFGGKKGKGMHGGKMALNPGKKVFDLISRGDDNVTGMDDLLTQDMSDDRSRIWGMPRLAQHVHERNANIGIPSVKLFSFFFLET